MLRRGSWRRTRAHEFVFQLARGPGYFADGVAVAAEATGEPPNNKRNSYQQVSKKKNVDGLLAIGARKTKNPRSVLDGSGLVCLTEAEYLELLELAGLAEPEPPNPTSVRLLSSEPFKDAHFATFPSELVRPLLLASTSERGCCPACGAPVVRITERRPLKRERPNEFTKRTGAEGTGNKMANTVDGVETITLGWRPSCACEAGEPEPCRVLDPFNGAGTTGLVARRLGLRYVGLELFEGYDEMARARIAADSPLFNC